MSEMVKHTDATISINSSPSPGFLTLTSSIFHPPFARVSRQTMALPLLDDILQLAVCGCEIDLSKAYECV